MTSLARQQQQFTAYMRDPEHMMPPPNIEQQRLNVYQRLLYNNINGFLSNSFPVLHTILPQVQWHAIVRDFMVKHRCHTPYFSEISQEFLCYLQETRTPQTADPPFMLALAHYEWVELVLNISMDNIDSITADPGGDLLEELPVVSPLVWSLVYPFPVHQISSSFQPQQPSAQPHYLMIYRNRDHKVGFMESNAVTARLLECLQCGDSQTGGEALRQLADEMQREPQAIIQYGLQILLKLRRLDIILGTR